jgi:hypothetical protein
MYILYFFNVAAAAVLCGFLFSAFFVFLIYQYLLIWRYLVKKESTSGAEPG